MKCPACYNQLTATQVGSMQVDVCQDGCGGIWFDAYELQRVDDEGEAAGDRLLDIRRDDQIFIDPARKRECPRCDGIKLHRHYFSAKRRVQVDECPNCGGYWLDAGELAQIREERRRPTPVEPGPTGGVSVEVIRYLYRLRLDSKES